jgi:hypothetical protein
VLYSTPRIGLADNGDFNRIIKTCGLQRTQEDIDNPDLRFYDYSVSTYDWDKITNIRPTSSMVFLINIGRFLGFKQFNFDQMAMWLLILYCIGFGFIIRSLYEKQKLLSWIFGILSILIIFDGKYLMWMRSLFGEATMYVGLLLFIGYFSYLWTCKKSISLINSILLFFSAGLFVGSKLQTISALPIIILLMTMLLIKSHKEQKSKLILISMITFIFIVSSVVIAGFLISRTLIISEYTTYNSIFKGVLLNSDTPSDDLEFLGLTDEYIPDIGKNAYEADDSYAVHPMSDQAKEEIYANVSTFDILKLYLEHPDRLYDSMVFSAEELIKGPSYRNGKYSISDFSEPKKDFEIFTLWTQLREKIYPNIFLIHLVIWIISIILIFIFIKKHGLFNKNSILPIIFFGFMSIAVLQFPLPIIGNGRADTAKQLFLYNYNTDLSISLLLSSLLTGFILLIKNKLLCKKVNL